MAMVATVPASAFTQNAESLTERVPETEETPVADRNSVAGRKIPNEETSAQTESRVKIEVGSERLIEIGIERRFNEIRSELLDERNSIINFWLGLIAALFVGFGIFGVTELRRLREDAQKIVEEIKGHRDKATGLVEKMTVDSETVESAAAESAAAESAAAELRRMTQVVNRVLEKSSSISRRQ